MWVDYEFRVYGALVGLVEPGLIPLYMRGDRDAYILLVYIATWAAVGMQAQMYNYR